MEPEIEQQELFSCEHLNATHGFPRKYEAILGRPLLSLTLSQLLAYHHKSYGYHASTSLAYAIYKMRGVYAITIRDNVYIGSTSGPEMYFGRRWKLHAGELISGKQAHYNHRLQDLYDGIGAQSVVFHALLICESFSRAHAEEWRRIADFEDFYPDRLINSLKLGGSR